VRCSLYPTSLFDKLKSFAGLVPSEPKKRVSPYPTLLFDKLTSFVGQATLFFGYEIRGRLITLFAVRNPEFKDYVLKNTCY
jgi:hypothetical protein